jgi:flagellar protein FliO/FliZ
MEDVSVLSLLGRLVISLAVVLGLMALLAKVLRNRTVPGIGRAAAQRDLLRIVARQSLSRSASVAVVRAAERALVIGVTDAGVNVLAELDPASLEIDEPDGDPSVVPALSWRTFLDTLRDRSVRRG